MNAETDNVIEVVNEAIRKMLRCNSEVYEGLIMTRDDSAVLTLFEKIVDVAA